MDGDVDFQPEYDADGNQTRVKTGTGIWTVSYDAENRPTDFTSQATDGTITTVHCEYDYMGRRTTKMVTVGNNVTLQQRYIYRGYLQIACIDLTRATHPALWFITWDPTQSVATRPLAIQKDGSWFTYGWDLTKNICELYGPAGYIRTSYSYSPYGQVTSTGDVEQSIQWSSEHNDTELGLIYYNYRHYNPVDGRWIGRDCIYDKNNLYGYVNNHTVGRCDFIGLASSNPIYFDTLKNPQAKTLIEHLFDLYNVVIFAGIDTLQKTYNEETWQLVEDDLKGWLNGQNKGETKYSENDPRTQVIKNSYIGQYAESLFIKKNKSKHCDRWSNMTDISVKLPNTRTIIDISLYSLFGIPVEEQTLREITRFFTGLQKGSTAFVGSVSVDIDIKKVGTFTNAYIEATYRVSNPVSSQSYYLRLPDFITGRPIETWMQIYKWRKYYSCCDGPYVPFEAPEEYYP